VNEKFPKSIKIIAADRPTGVETLQKLLRDIAVVVPVTTMEAAVDVLASPFDLVICGVHFDDSRMFDLLTFVRQKDQSLVRSFLIFRDLESELDPTFFRSLEIAAEVSGAAGFVDLYSLKMAEGLDKADEHFRTIVSDLVARTDLHD
jgi:PleD family two-component response regulator